MQEPVAAWPPAVRDEHPPAVAHAPDPRILHRRSPRHIATEREPPCGWVERIRATRFDHVDAPPLIDPIDVAHIEAPAVAVAKDRAPLDRRAREVLARRAPDRLEPLAVAARDPEFPSTTRAGPATAIDEGNNFAVAKRSGSSGPVARARTGRFFDHDRRACIERRVHFRANFS